MKLQVKVVKATNLTAKDPNGRSDPYCQVYLGATDVTVHKTEIKSGTLDPVWKETFVIYDGELTPFLYSPDGVEYQISGYLMVDVWDHDTMNQDDFLGQVMLPLRGMTIFSSHEEWYPLTRRNPKEKVSGAILLETQLKVDKTKIVDNKMMDSHLYQRCKLRGYHLPILSGKDIVELPGRTEKVEMAFSNVFVEISSNHGLAQVYLTNYRLVILSNRHHGKNGRSRASSVDLSTWIALNNIMSVDTGHETIVARKNQKKQKTTSITIHCYDIRLIKLIFAVERRERNRPSITTAISEVPKLSSRLQSAASSSKQLGLKFKSKAPGKKLLQTLAEKSKSIWHIELNNEDLRRTHSDALSSGPPHTKKERAEGHAMGRPRSQSGESAVLVKLRPGGASEGDFNKSGASGSQSVTKGDGDFQFNGLSEALDIHQSRNGELSETRALRRRSRSLEDVLSTRDFIERDFCLLSYTEPDESETGGAYDIIFDECEYLSDEDMVYDHSMEVKDLTPMNSSSSLTMEGMDNRVVTPPRASKVLITTFLHRIENVMVNGVHYPPGLFFVQLYVGYLQLTGWDMYNFPKEMDRQEVCEESWRLSVQNGPEYKLCATYPQLMYVPKNITDLVVLESSNFRSKNRLPCLVWVDSKRKNFMLRCAQPLAGKSGKHSLEDEQLIKACLDAGPPDGEMVIYDARSAVAATGNMLKGKGTENITHYPRTKYTYLDIPNIHAVRESFESLRNLCLSSESSKWYSILENTQWLTNLSLIIKGAVMIARYMKLQRGNALVHCSDGWDRTSQLTSLAQLILDPYYRTMTGFMVLIEKEWLAFGHKFQHRLGHPDHPNERSPIFLQFLDCVHQMLRMFQNSFEFNSHFLLRIADHLHTGWFGTFLCNCDKERHDLSLYARSPSLWAHLEADKEALLNKDFTPNRQPIFPTSNLRHLKLWEEYFLRHDSSSLTSHSWRREMENPAPVQRQTSVFTDHLQESWTTDHVIWMADDKTSECLLCHSKFTAFRRKHHCRACGHIFCDDCSKNKIALAHLGYNRPERVCVECYSKLNAAQKTSDADNGFVLVTCKENF